MRIAYVTSSLPQGAREAFFIPELQRLHELGHDVTVVPTRPQGRVVHGECAELAHRSDVHGLLCPHVLAAAVIEIVRSPRAVARALAPLRLSRSRVVFLKNLLVVPKALWLARRLRRQRIEHVHSGWLSTPATVAMVAAELARVPWSASAHRWDIEEDNLLAEKVQRAAFVRVISRRGAAAIEQRAPRTERVRLIRMGIPVPPLDQARGTASRRIVIAANLIPLKGHRFLLDAVARLRRAGLDVHLDVLGDGPLRETLRSHCDRAGIVDAVSFHGAVPHDRLLGDLTTGRWAAAVVASVVDEDGATEGVPVIMLEAMARGVPVVATDVGGIAEIAGERAALLVPQRNPDALAAAIRTVLGEPAVAEQLVARAHARVRSECDVAAVVDALVAEIASAAADIPEQAPFACEAAA